MTATPLKVDDRLVQGVIEDEKQAAISPSEPVAPTAEAVLEQYADPDGASQLHTHDMSLLAPLEHELALVASLTPIRRLRGVPLYYERLDVPKPYSFRVARSFLPMLEATVDHVRARVPSSYGKLLRISSAGMYVAKAGRHGEGRACDWDRWTFEHVDIAPRDRHHAAQDLARRRRYWALAAICRSLCCFTLHGEYDLAHTDHLHVDNSISTAFNTSFSTITLLQAVLNVIHGASPQLKVDGAYGPRTRAATLLAIKRLGLSGDVYDRLTWIAFLQRSARLGFTLAAPGRS
jgi:hypothetical protein